MSFSFDVNNILQQTVIVATCGYILSSFLWWLVTAKNLGDDGVQFVNVVRGVGMVYNSEDTTPAWSIF